MTSWVGGGGATVAQKIHTTTNDKGVKMACQKISTYLLYTKEGSNGRMEEQKGQETENK